MVSEGEGGQDVGHPVATCGNLWQPWADRVLALRRKQEVGSIDLDPSIPRGLDSWILGF